MGKEIEKLGIDLIALNNKRYHKFSLKIIIKLYRLMKKKHIHVVRTHKYRASLYGRLAAWLAGTPVIISSVHGNYRKDLRLERKIANKILSRITDKIIAVSESIKRDIVKHDKIDPSKILVIYNGIDGLKFDPSEKSKNIREKLLINTEDIVVGFVGRLVPAKGLEYLIGAISYLKEEFKNIKLLIVGEGSLLIGLKDKARENGIHDRVIFTGQRRDVPDILHSTDIFVMPSVAEGIPNALLEAMAMGKPIIATKVGGIPEIIEDGFNGLLVPPRDSGVLAAAIKTLMDNRQLATKIGQTARDFAQNFSIKATAQKWELLYTTLLRKKGVTITREVETSL